MVATAGLALAASSASGATITVSGTSITVDCSIPAGEQNCQGLTGGSFVTSGNGANTQVVSGVAGSLSNTAADLYDLASSSGAFEGSVIDFLLDGSGDGDVVNGVKTNAQGVDALTFSSSAQYIAFKTGNPLGTGEQHFFLKLLGSQQITLIYDKNGETGGGFSHYTEFGQLTTVPLPAAGWMLIAGVGGLGAMKRRAKKKAA
eukprot:CAMPEP_0181218444 /NCGR_PEP_ID=MMETSP1096-20121128/27700_1 /TAXON_ID=156174 ORGANISM="Chrysochromulina ericina, Strain CCMP281" /NCGR_SAMPLE_ID=MMETSP1096 /ASSEMBLY_ACC=CAM_ASM_000453 /LENGTH=202 /DNA_ID=CAMNT_0023310667 /DNA_START=115 /DNA_END=723 /DNA_ORIENTATION=+